MYDFDDKGCIYSICYSLLTYGVYIYKWQGYSSGDCRTIASNRMINKRRCVSDDLPPYVNSLLLVNSTIGYFCLFPNYGV